MTDDLKRAYHFGTVLSEAVMKKKGDAYVGFIMGSDSDWPKVMAGCDLLEELEIAFEYGVVSAHRTPGRMEDYARDARNRGLKAIIACAGGSAHLPGMTASSTILPVYGVGVLSATFGPDDVLGSCVRMPKGCPLAFMGFDTAGAVNAALQAARWLALNNSHTENKLKEWVRQQQVNVPFACHD